MQEMSCYLKAGSNKRMQRSAVCTFEMICTGCIDLQQRARSTEALDAETEFVKRGITNECKCNRKTRNKVPCNQL